jgi:hypothetical protein
LAGAVAYWRCVPALAGYFTEGLRMILFALLVLIGTPICYFLFGAAGLGSFALALATTGIACTALLQWIFTEFVQGKNGESWFHGQVIHFSVSTKWVHRLMLLAVLVVFAVLSRRLR